MMLLLKGVILEKKLFDFFRDFTRKCLKKVTGKSDGDVDDVVTKKGEGKEKK